MSGKSTESAYTIDEITLFYSLTPDQTAQVSTYLLLYQNYLTAQQNGNLREAVVNLAYASDIERNLGLSCKELDLIVNRYFGL